MVLYYIIYINEAIYTLKKDGKRLIEGSCRNVASFFNLKTMDEIYEFMEDHDEFSLNEEEWEELLLEAAHVYYENHPERRVMKDKSIISNYKSWKREKYAPEQ
jgi:hypothetical protein